MSGDGERARELYRFLTGGAPEADALFAVIPWATPVKPRPRAGKGRVYTPREALDAEAETAKMLRLYLPGGRPLVGNVAIGCIFYRPDRRKLDVDNLLKHILDAANGVTFADDSQVTRVFGDIELDRDNPRTLVVMGRHISTLSRAEPARRAQQASLVA